VTQPVDAVAHHEAHGAGVVVRPDRIGAVLALGLQEFFGDEIEGCVPGHRFEAARALRPLADERLRQAIGMVYALGVARDLGADHARRVGIVGSAAHAADGALVENLDLERARRGAVMRTGRGADPDSVGANGLIHRPTLASCLSPVAAA
jgi:hypothetical protein